MRLPRLNRAVTNCLAREVFDVTHKKEDGRNGAWRRLSWVAMRQLFEMLREGGHYAGPEASEIHSGSGWP